MGILAVFTYLEILKTMPGIFFVMIARGRCVEFNATRKSWRFGWRLEEILLALDLP